MTSSRKVLLLAIAAVAVMAIALLASRRDSALSPSASSSLLFPELKQELAAVDVIRIFKAGDTAAVQLTRKDNVWVVSERSGFPANAQKVNKLLLELGDAKTIEEKTSNADLYAALGVEDLKNPAASGARIELSGAKTPVSLIVGKSAGTRGAYVRRAGEAQSWLIDQSLDVSSAPHEWLRTRIVDVSADRVQSTTVTPEGTKPYTLEKATRADASFKLDAAVPKGKEVESYALNAFASSLMGVNLSDARPAQEFAADKPAAHATTRTFDGLVFDLDGWVKDGKHYIAVRTSYDDALAQRFHVETKPPADTEAATADATPAKPATEPEDMAATAKRTQEQLSGWVFEVPDYKYEALFKPLSELLKK